MSAWDDMMASVITWTNRPTMVNETTLALRNAIRNAHRLGKFWRDITTVIVVPNNTDQVQSISLTDTCPRMRQLAFLQDVASDAAYRETSASDLLDEDGFHKVDVYWGVGSALTFRLGRPTNQLKIGYYLQPVTSPPEAVGDWLTDAYPDVVVLMAATTILSMIGEQEIKGRVDQLLAIAAADLISDQLEVYGR